MKFLRFIPSFIRLDVERGGNLREILGNLAWLFFDKFIRVFMGLLVGAWVARYLGPGPFGELAYIVALVGLFQSATQLGLDNIAVRDISRNPELASEILGTIFRLRIVSGFVCYAGVIVAVYLLRPADDRALLLSVIVAGIIIFQSADTIDLWFQSELQSKRTVLAKLCAYISVSIARVGLIILNMPLIAFAAALLIEAALSALALTYSYGKHPTGGRWQWSAKRSHRLIVEGLPFLLSGIILTAYLQTDRLLLSALMGSVELGYYVAALTLSGVFGFLPIILCASLAPGIAGIADSKARERFFVKLNSIFFWCGILLALAIFALAEPLINFLYGDEYSASILVLKVHAFSLIPIFLSVANDYLALNSGKGTVTLLRTIAGLVVNISLNYLLIPEFGAVGAALSSLAAHVIANTLVFWLLMRESFVMHRDGLILPFTTIHSLIRSRPTGCK